MGRWKVIWLDAACRAAVDWAEIRWLWVLKVAPKTGCIGFHAMSKRWVVERMFGGLNRYRRVSNDHERTTESSEMFILHCHDLCNGPKAQELTFFRQALTAKRCAIYG